MKGPETRQDVSIKVKQETQDMKREGNLTKRGCDTYGLAECIVDCDVLDLWDSHLS